MARKPDQKSTRLRQQPSSAHAHIVRCPNCGPRPRTLEGKRKCPRCQQTYLAAQITVQKIY